MVVSQVWPLWMAGGRDRCARAKRVDDWLISRRLVTAQNELVVLTERGQGLMRAYLDLEAGSVDR